MATTVNLNSIKSASISDGSAMNEYNNHNNTFQNLGSGNPDFTLLVGFAAPTGADRFKKILGCTVNVYAKYYSDPASISLFFAGDLPADFNEATVSRLTYNPYNPYGQTAEARINSADGWKNYALEFGTAWSALNILKNGVAIRAFGDAHSHTEVHTSRGSNPPTLALHLGDAVYLEFSKLMPAANSSIFPVQSNRFSFECSYDKYIAEELNAVSGKFRWRKYGESNVNESILPTGQSYIDIPAGTFSDCDRIEYQFEITDNSGHTENSDWTAIYIRYLVFDTVSPPAGSRINRTEDTAFTFSVKTENGGYPYPLSVRSAIYRWRVFGVDSYTENPLESGMASLSVPGWTFPAGEVEYQFSFTSNAGRSQTSAWIKVSTLDTVPGKAKGIYPNGSIVNADNAVEFKWEHINESGQPQSKAELQLSTDGADWTEFATVVGSQMNYMTAEGVLASGTWYWRVRTYNLDGAAGEWSDVIEFITVATPNTPIIVAKNTSSRPCVIWQTNEQEACELQLDDELPVIRFGAEKSWTCPRYLDDGQHEVRVRVQNQYGLWSDWGRIVVPVQNSAGPDFILTVKTDYDAVLVWEDKGYDFYLVYRNGIVICKTEATEFTDYFSVGNVSYFIRGCYTDSYHYGRSNVAEVTVYPDAVVVGNVPQLGTVGWLPLPLSDEQHRIIKTTRSRTISTMHLTGREYPSAEVSEFYDKTIVVSCAFSDRQNCAALQALLGHLVCLKTPDGEMAIGYLSNLTKSAGEFYTGFNFSVKHLDFEEEIDIDS